VRLGTVDVIDKAEADAIYEENRTRREARRKEQRHKG
jgi:hypothetical protein